MDDTPLSIADAEASLERRDLPLAEALFRKALANRRLDDGDIGRAAFGLGNVLQLQGEYAEAQRFFSLSVNKGYRAEASLRSLAHLAGALGDKEEQEAFTAAAEARTLAAPAEKEGKPSPRGLRSARTTSEGLDRRRSSDSGIGVLESLLIAEDSEPARISVELMKRLRARRTPYLSAYLGLFVRKFTIVAVIVLIINWISGFTHSRPTDPSIFSNAALAYLIVSTIYLIYKVKTSYFEIDDQGRILHRIGGLSRHTPILEIFRAHNFEVERTFLNRLTGDGTVVAVGERETSQPTIRLRGFVKKKDLEQLALDLRDLNRALRATTTIRGIIK